MDIDILGTTKLPMNEGTENAKVQKVLRYYKKITEQRGCMAHNLVNGKE